MGAVFAGGAVSHGSSLMPEERGAELDSDHPITLLSACSRWPSPLWLRMVRAFTDRVATSRGLCSPWHNCARSADHGGNRFTRQGRHSGAACRGTNKHWRARLRKRIPPDTPHLTDFPTRLLIRVSEARHQTSPSGESSGHQRSVLGIASGHLTGICPPATLQGFGISRPPGSRLRGAPASAQAAGSSPANPGAAFHARSSALAPNGKRDPGLSISLERAGAELGFPG